MNIISTKLNNFFSIEKFGSNIRTEVLAGVSTFLSLSYIFVVNPAILSEGGMPKSGAFFATIVGSVITTLVMGLWANKPFAVAPGLEMNAFVAFVVSGTMGFTWQEAMGAVFWSGVLTVIFSLTNIRVKVMEAIPDKLKTGLAASVGMFLVLIALKVSGILAFSGIKVVGVGNLVSKESAVFFVGFLLVLGLKQLKIRGAVLLSIIGASVLAHFIGLGKNIETISFGKDLFSSVFALDFSVIYNAKIWSVIIILFILDFYGSIAKFIGLTRKTSIVDEKGNIPKMKEALIVDGGGTVLGAGLGTSNLITFVESAVGIGEGGRTGFTAVVVAGLMALFLPLLPLVNLVPVVATTGALSFVGLLLFPWGEIFQDLHTAAFRRAKLDLKKRPWPISSLFSSRFFPTYHPVRLQKSSENASNSTQCVSPVFNRFVWIESMAVLLMVVVTIMTFGLDKAMFAGFLGFLILFLLTGKWKQINIYLVASTLLLALSIFLSK